MFLIQKKWLHFTWQGRAVQTALSLDEGLKQVVHIHYIDQISPEYQDKLVHLSGSLQTDRVRVMSFVPWVCLLQDSLNTPEILWLIFQNDLTDSLLGSDY